MNYPYSDNEFPFYIFFQEQCYATTDCKVKKKKSEIKFSLILQLSTAILKASPSTFYNPTMVCDGSFLDLLSSNTHFKAHTRTVYNLHV